MEFPNASPSDSPLWGVLASLLVLVTAAWAGNELIQNARVKDDGWGMRREVAHEYSRRWGQELELTERSGARFTAQNFMGQATVVAFFYSRCAQSCPVLMQALARLHGDLASSGVQLACITVESSNDSVSALDAYAKRLGAAKDWLFLTGDETAIRRLATDHFFASLQVKPDEPVGRYITHASRLYLVNRRGEICNQVEVVRRLDPTREESPFEIDEAALRKVKLMALDLQYETWLGLVDLPHVNAILNASAALLLLLGLILIRQGLPRAHAATMIAAVLVSGLFLVSYLYYHRYAGETRFTGSGLARPFYLALLISHVFLAIVTVPLVLITLYRAARGQFASHRRIARWTLPIWFYVSVSGLAVYLCLYQWLPS